MDNMFYLRTFSVELRDTFAVIAQVYLLLYFIFNDFLLINFNPPKFAFTF